jgi:hypothetical protein
MPISTAKQKYTDSTVDRFVKTNMHYSIDPYILFQDPTYLGFKLFFLFNQPDSGLLSTKAHPNTAMGYLKRIGDTVRADYLRKFINHLREINQKTPWFFQTIEGLGDAWKHGYQEDAFKSLLPADRKIKIGCLDESVDLRITALMDLYRKACFDWPNRREVVPQNLRYFKIGIYCYESRTINRRGYPGSLGLLDIQGLAGLPDVNEKQQDFTAFLLGNDPNGKQINSRGAITSAARAFNTDPVAGIENALSRNDAPETTDSPNNNISRVMFNFGFCEFLPDESGTFFDSMTNKEMKLAAQTITFGYRTVYEDNVFNVVSTDRRLSDLVTLYVDSAALDNPNLSLNPKFADSYGLFDASNPLAGQLAPFASLAADRIERLVSSYASKLLMGNVYGFSPTDAAQTAQALISGDPVRQAQAVGKTIRQAFDNKSLNNETRDATPRLFFDVVTRNSSGTIQEGANIGFGESSSMTNDDGPDSTSQAVGNNVASSSNNEGSSPSTSQGTGNPNASLSNDNGSDSTSQGTGNPNASLNNENGSSPSTSQGTGNPNASLSNDDGSNSATSQGANNSTSSLSNDDGSNSSTSQGTNNPNASLSNDDGPDSTSQGTGNPNASLSNDTTDVSNLGNAYS